MHEKKVKCVYFPELDRFVVGLEGTSVGRDSLLRSKWYLGFEYLRYLPDYGVSLAGVDEFLETFPQELCCEVTNLCNFSCPICIADAHQERGTQMDTDVYTRVLEDRVDTIKRISLTGGEPTLHPCLQEMVEQAKQAVSAVVLATNGFLPKRIESALTGNPGIIVSISLHGPKREHDSFVGCSGAYERASESIQVAAAYRATIQINTTIVRHTLKGLRDLTGILSELPISEHRLNIVKHRGRRLVSSVRYEPLAGLVAELKVPYKISIKKKDQPFMFIDCEGRKEIRHAQEC